LFFSLLAVLLFFVSEPVVKLPQLRCRIRQMFHHIEADDRVKKDLFWEVFWTVDALS
jgi:hypothetical protein